jgi:hypothetical protein
MSKIALTPNASGTGTLTIAAPDTNTDRTITLPDSTSTLATTADLAGVESITLLGTIATTSGSSVTLSGLTLTGYKQLQFVFEGVSGTASSSFLRLNDKYVAPPTITGAGDSCTGGGHIDLASGVFWASSATLFGGGGGAADKSSGGASGLTTSSTSITFTISAGTFDAGSIRIYGVK